MVQSNMNMNVDLQQSRLNASTLLGKFAVDTLKNRKWITKSFTSTFPFRDDYSSKTSQNKLFKVLFREFLKSYSFLKHAATPDIDIKVPSVIGSGVSVYVTGKREAVLIRYVRMLNRKLVSINLPYVISLQGNVFYKGWETVKGHSHVLILNFNNFRQAIGVSESRVVNPYKLFLILDDILKVFGTLSKYTAVVNNPTITVHPLYQSSADLLREQKRLKKEAEAIATIANAKKKDKTKYDDLVDSTVHSLGTTNLWSNLSNITTSTTSTTSTTITSPRSFTIPITTTATATANATANQFNPQGNNTLHMSRALNQLLDRAGINTNNRGRTEDDIPF